MESQNITPTSEDYIKAIITIYQRKQNVRVKDIADTLAVKKPSVVTAIRILKEKGLVTHEHYGNVELTSEGMKVAQKLQKNHSVIFHFLHVMLGISAELAYDEACNLEHYLSEDSFGRLRRLADFLNNLPAHRHVELDRLLNKTNKKKRHTVDDESSQSL